MATAIKTTSGGNAYQVSTSGTGSNASPVAGMSRAVPAVSSIVREQITSGDGNTGTTNWADYYNSISGPSAPSGGGSGGSSASTAAAEAEPEKTAEEIAAEKQAELEEKAKEELGKHWADAAATTKEFVTSAELPDVEISRVDHVDDAELRDMLRQIVESQKQQTEQRTDYTVERGVNELQRALEDAAEGFQTERNQVSADEARALDNQALYSEARGDRGGIGESQYASIQNTAATNRLKVNQAQTKLATDTSRQIADLRAQGEFEKADALLSITQSYLSELKSLEQWALQTNVSIDEFNIAVEEWEAEYRRTAQQFLINTEMSAAQLTGAFANGTPTLAAQEQLREQLAATGQIFLDMGLTPTPAQIQAMGLTQEQYEAYTAKKKGGGGSSGGGGYNSNIWNEMKNSKVYGTYKDSGSQTPAAPAAASEASVNAAIGTLNQYYGSKM